MGAPPVLIGQATQKRGSTVTGKGRQAVGGGGGGGARGFWRGGGDGGVSCIDWTGHTENGGGTVTVYEGRAGRPLGGGGGGGERGLERGGWGRLLY